MLSLSYHFERASVSLVQQDHAKLYINLQEVELAHRMTSQTPTGENPFELAFGTKKVILVKVGFTSFKADH